MKKSVVALSLLLMLLISGCDLVLPEGPPDIDTVKLQESTLDSVYLLDDFSLDTIKLDITYNDGTSKLKPFNDAWVESEQLNALESAGSHTIEYTYEYQGLSYSGSFELKLVDNEKELIIHRIHELGLEEDAVLDGYASWKESIRGEDGEDGEDGRTVEIKRDGDMIVWRYENADTWETLVHIDELTSEAGTAPLEAIDAAKNATVGVAVTREDGSGSGSGMIYKQENGTYYMVTNYHVVEDAQTVEIAYSIDGNLFFEEDSVEKIGSYPEADIAVYAFETEHTLGTLDFADERPSIGEAVYAIGHGGGFQAFNTVTSGIASKHHVNVVLDDVNAYFLQHDAPINPGNSGGPLIDKDGNIIGMNSIKVVADQFEGIGYALPYTIMMRMIEELEETGTVVRGELGIMTTSLEDCNATTGVCIGEISEDKTADMMGLEVNDRIVGIRSETMDSTKTIQNPPQLIEWLYATRANRDIQIEYVRGGETFTTEWVELLPRDE